MNRPFLPLTLRGHHLLCSISYSGAGYSPEFIANFDDLCARLTAGEEVRLTFAPDTICKPMLGSADCHCHRPHILLRDLLGFLSASLATGRLLWPGRTVRFTKADVARLRGSFRAGWVRAGCIRCPWFDHCTRTAREGYRESKLHPKRLH
jgi:uncharacterized protein